MRLRLTQHQALPLAAAPGFIAPTTVATWGLPALPTNMAGASYGTPTNSERAARITVRSRQAATWSASAGGDLLSRCELFTQDRRSASIGSNPASFSPCTLTCFELQQLWSRTVLSEQAHTRDGTYWH